MYSFGHGIGMSIRNYFDTGIRITKGDFLFGLLIAIICASYMLFHHGIASPVFGYFFHATFFGESIANTDSEFLKTSTSIFIPLFHNIFDIPIFHIVVGFLLRSAIFLLLYILIYTHYKKHSIATVAVALFSLFSFWFPMGTSSLGIQGALSFSARDFSTLLMILSLMLFLNSRYIMASLAIGLSIYFQSLDPVHLYIISVLALVLLHFFDKDSLSSRLKILALYIVPCLVMIIPYFIRIHSFNPVADLSLISTADWWNFALKNEPGDVSITHIFFRYGYRREIFYSILSLAIIFFNLYVVNKKYEKYSIASRDILIKSSIFIFVSWIVIAFALIYERYLLYFPDFINDIFIPWQFRRATYIPSLFCIPAIAYGIVQILLVISDVIKKVSSKLKSFIAWLLVDKRFASAILVALLLLLVMRLPQFYNPVNLDKYMNVNHQPYSFFTNENTYAYLSKSPQLTSAELTDVCEWVRDNIPEDARLFSPPYIKEISVLAEHRCFLSEKSDGDMACFDRKYATIYLTRFSDLLSGLSYSELTKPEDCQGGEAYRQIRQRYLGLTDNDFAKLANKYPGYSYILTEKEHMLNFEVLYTNSEYIVYEMESTGQK